VINKIANVNAWDIPKYCLYIAENEFMKRIGSLIIIIICLNISYTYAQWNVEGKRNLKWYFGLAYNYNVIDFTNASATQVPTIDTTQTQGMDAYYNYSMIDDTTGNLLFYSNGSIIYDSTLNPMQNGNFITPNYYNNIMCFADGVLILPMPNHDSLYYIFTTTSDTPCVIIGTQYIYYSIVDMKSNNGKGAVVSKANLLFSSNTLADGHLKACRHANGRDWWLLMKDVQGNTFYRFLVSPTGIQTFATQTIGTGYLVGDAWQAAFSPTGDKYAINTGYGPFVHDTTSLNIYDFDRCTGLLSNPIQYPVFRTDTTTLSSIFSICFSPNGKYLYWSNSDSIFQYDLQTNTSINVAVYDTMLIPHYEDSLGLKLSLKFYFMQLGHDNRIYIGTFYNHLHYIDKPDMYGAACDVHQFGIKLPKLIHPFFINMPFYTTPPIWGSGCDSLTPVSIKEGLYFDGLSIYPNPSDGEFVIEVSNTNTWIEVYNMLGELVLKQRNTLKRFAINLHNEANGMYMVKLITDDKEIAWRKIIKK